MQSKSSLAQLTGCALGLAALVAAAALLIFAFVFAGLIRPDWMTAPGGVADLLPGRGGTATPLPAAVPPGVTSVATSTIPVLPAGGDAAGRAVATAARGPARGTPTATAAGVAPARGTATGAAAAFTPDTPAPARDGAPASARAPRTTATLVVEDWTGYADDEALAGAFNVNLGWADNTLDLSLLGEGDGPGGRPGMAARYAITAQAPNDYVGFERDLEAMTDWSPYTHLVLRVDAPTPAALKLVVQWYEATGEVWTHTLPLAEVPADGLVRIPLTADAWTWAEWSDRRNQKMDPQMATRFGIFVGHGGPAEGTIRFGSLDVVRIAE